MKYIYEKHTAKVVINSLLQNSKKQKRSGIFRSQKSNYEILRHLQK